MVGVQQPLPSSSGATSWQSPQPAAPVYVGNNGYAAPAPSSHLPPDGQVLPPGCDPIHQGRGPPFTAGPYPGQTYLPSTAAAFSAPAVGSTAFPVSSAETVPGYPNQASSLQRKMPPNYGQPPGLPVNNASLDGQPPSYRA